MKHSSKPTAYLLCMTLAALTGAIMLAEMAAAVLLIGDRETLTAPETLGFVLFLFSECLLMAVAYGLCRGGTRRLRNWERETTEKYYAVAARCMNAGLNGYDRSLAYCKYSDDLSLRVLIVRGEIGGFRCVTEKLDFDREAWHETSASAWFDSLDAAIAGVGIRG